MRVWDLNSEGAWIGSGLDNGSSGMNNEWQAHKGAVWDVCWGHPEFGQVLATAGGGGFYSHVTLFGKNEKEALKAWLPPNGTSKAF